MHDNIVPKPELALELGKSISLTEAEEEVVAREVHATHARIIRFRLKTRRGIQTLTPAKQEAADIMKALKESKKISKRQPGTGGSNEGTGKLILEWEADVDSEHFDRDDNAGDDNEETNPDPEEIYKAVDPVGSPSSTTIDQDEHLLVLHQQIKKFNLKSLIKTDSSQKEMEFLFNHFFEEYFSPINVHAEENNNDQAANASLPSLVHRPQGVWELVDKDHLLKAIASRKGTDFEESFAPVAPFWKLPFREDKCLIRRENQCFIVLLSGALFQPHRRRDILSFMSITKRVFKGVEIFDQRGTYCYKDGKEHLKMEMEIPCSNKIKFITACSFSNDSFEDIMKAQVSVIKASATLNIQAFKIKKSVSISFRMTQVHKMAKDHMMMIKDYDWMMISKKLKDHIQVKLKPKSLKFTASDSQDTDQ
ncbi:hypothetical protein Tco_0890733 [Tanacetum coccineum]|uniref:Uncharacterized protein n=1 Tax=Tanacetum coccineum TaxID=301880 RepID=A0ABQ5C0Y0_9ASTR